MTVYELIDGLMKVNIGEIIILTICLWFFCVIGIAMIHNIINKRK